MTHRLGETGKPGLRLSCPPLPAGAAPPTRRSCTSSKHGASAPAAARQALNEPKHQKITRFGRTRDGLAFRVLFGGCLLSRTALLRRGVQIDTSFDFPLQCSEPSRYLTFFSLGSTTGAWGSSSSGKSMSESALSLNGSLPSVQSVFPCSTVRVREVLVIAHLFEKVLIPELSVRLGCRSC